jgi:hypothetical protein
MSSNISNEPGNRPARDYDRHIDRLNAGEDEPILEPEDAEFVADLVEGLRELATKAQDETVLCPKCNMGCEVIVEAEEKPDGNTLGYASAQCEDCGHDLTEDEIYGERKA